MLCSNTAAVRLRRKCARIPHCPCPRVGAWGSFGSSEPGNISCNTSRAIYWAAKQGGHRLAQNLTRFLTEHPRWFVLSGAGLSAPSGIPSYRDDQGRWKSGPPIDALQFERLPSVRKCFWARSMVAWPQLADAQPNEAHLALTLLQSAGFVQCIVTQNVDGLHQRAGSHAVIELHGNVTRVACLECKADFPRRDVQAWLEHANPRLAHRLGSRDLEEATLDNFQIPECPSCGGILKPRAIFFGDAVPRERIALATESLQQAQAVLVLGSSLMLYSGYRYCTMAHQLRKPIAAVNLGVTRADPLLTLKVERCCTQVLAELAQTLALAHRTPPSDLCFQPNQRGP